MKIKKIEIEKKDLKQLYINEDKTTRDIACIYNCEKSTISRRLKKYGIQIKRHKRKYSFYYGQKINEEQKQLILGSLLGDGCISKHHDGENGYRFIEQHSIKQLEYLMMKKNILNNFISSKTRRIDNSKNKSYGNGIAYSICTVLHKEFEKFYKMFYINEKKIVPYFDLKPFSLAIWYFDDGSLDVLKNNKYIITLHTEGFDEKSIENARKILFDNFNIKSFLVFVKNKYYVIRLNSTETNKMINIIKKYYISCMNHKLKFIDNPVETCSVQNEVSVLKCSDANTLGSLYSLKEMMV